MPYIQQHHRPEIDDLIRDLADHLINTHIGQNSFTTLKPSTGGQGSTVHHSTREGDLNYAISKLLRLMYPPNSKYGDYNAAYGMLMCCAAEYYRTVIGPYEEKKRWENGDVV